MRTSVLLFALLATSFAQDLCQTCNTPRDVFKGKRVILDQVIESNGLLSLFYYTFKGYVYERCTDTDCSATSGPYPAIPGRFDGNYLFTASTLGEMIVAATAQTTDGVNWKITAALDGKIVIEAPIKGQITGIDLVDTPNGVAFLGITGKVDTDNFFIVYGIGVSALFEPAITSTFSTSNSTNVIVGAVSPDGLPAFAVSTNSDTVAVVTCASPSCDILRYTPVGKFEGLNPKQGISIAYRNSNPVIFVSAKNDTTLHVVYCKDMFCLGSVVTETTYKAFPQSIGVAPDSSIIVASIENNANRVSIVKCQDSACTQNSVPLIVNNLTNPLVAILPTPSGVQVLLKTVGRNILINLCGPFPQSLQSSEITVSQGANLSVKGVGFCPEDNVISLDNYLLQGVVVSPNEVRVKLGPEVLSGTYQVGVQNSNGTRSAVILESDLRVHNGCPYNCSGDEDIGYCDEEADRCLCAPGYSGADCSHSDESVCPNDCGRNGVCDKQTKTCICLDGFRGEDCSQKGKACPNGCSSHGKCDTSTGTCQCSFFSCGRDCSKTWPVCR
ncbi:hypothetical protein PROFUN_12781 [Planoprotostelium fungivorum]|uniref:EGF-like domain-containing protein n=1 Tax=Planoprotostelium fungivorum TaxID=1890364 RepID=A0A2P6N6H3_9EUKA|nr:hypothetical protein PROFUN_12781 [Planoprotostelium fungivorum]